MSKSKEPSLRYQKFTDAWEQRKLGEVADIVGGGTPNTSILDYWGGDISWYSPVEIGDQVYMGDSRKKITELGLQKSSARMLPVGTVLFTSRAGIGNTAILIKEGCTNQGFQSIVPHETELDSYFIFSRTHELKCYGETNGAGSTFVEVSGKQMAKMPILLPSIKEQQKIGSFFQQLDNTIALHQHKSNKLKQIKKSLMSQMFPKDGVDTPELRIGEYSDNWKEEQLGQLVEQVKSYSLSRDVETKNNTGFRYIHYGDIHTKVADMIDSKSKLPNIKEGQYELLKKGDVVVADASEDYQGIATPAVITTELPYKLVAGLHTIALRPKKIDSVFLYYLIHSPAFREYGYRIGTGMKVFGISAKNLLNFEGKLPSIEEQTAIGNFFKHLDETIAIHQEKYEKLKQIKTALLNDMFV
ncbi:MULTISPECIES: restriction endonuclease subunit S [Enterococcus]|uniref:restriction endonuclease subunit S n=1 Tax=Enterococcus TaxID=1350 RepID=UPI000903AA73|nr:restriction endonuclease subunit S [Enterococcus faecalis]APE73017.1 restriction endonuclease subunit S [Enterococcus faecalis]MBW9291529.1 restriction endonuclease subunit S [Enterococcus faecalis]NSU15052.1 restriction endonuclease subunit S [Enterococcus faecalis]OOP45998.1 hypothetical protein BHU76_11405 [Enterococcus faecalis]PQF13990.1 restriction endonuclease subunit S [Enterococcus faecalis]